MLTRDEATALLAQYGGEAPWTRHCLAVASAAEAVGSLVEDPRIDLDVLWAVALLHDIGRYATHDPVMHGVEGYNLLMTIGHEDAAFVCASHIAFGLTANEAVSVGLPAQDFIPRTHEHRIVPLVDFLIEGERPTTLDLRIASLRERNQDNDPFLHLLDRAHLEAASFLRKLEDEIGRSVPEVVASCE
jgi:uncharacterized protein